MLELAPYGFAGLVAILLVAFCFACKDNSKSFSGKIPSCSIRNAELRYLEGVERRASAAGSNAGPKDQKHEGDSNG